MPNITRTAVPCASGCAQSGSFLALRAGGAPGFAVSGRTKIRVSVRFSLSRVSTRQGAIAGLAPGRRQISAFHRDAARQRSRIS